jgi:hypothetical protein
MFAFKRSLYKGMYPKPYLAQSSFKVLDTISSSPKYCDASYPKRERVLEYLRIIQDLVRRPLARGLKSHKFITLPTGRQLVDPRHKYGVATRQNVNQNSLAIERKNIASRLHGPYIYESFDRRAAILLRKRARAMPVCDFN